MTSKDWVQEMLSYKQAGAAESDKALAAAWKQVALAQKAAPRAVLRTGYSIRVVFTA